MKIRFPFEGGEEQEAVVDAQNETMRKTFFQFVRFCIVGLSNTCFSYGLNVLIIFFMRGCELSWDYIVANVTSFLLGTVWSYFWSAKFVFHVQQRHLRDVVQALLKSYATYGATGILLNNLLSWVWITRLGISRYLAPLINLSICIPLNYCLNRFWTFRKPAQPTDAEAETRGDTP